MSLTRLQAAVTVLAALAVPTFGADSAADVATVRAAYAKLVLESQVHALRDYAIADGKRAVETPPRFTISDISAGSLSEIVGTPVSRWMTKPSGYILQVTTEDYAFVEQNGTKTSAKAVKVDWRLGPHISEDWDSPISKLLEALDGRNYTRYVAYSVTVEHQGRSRSYRALFLFGQEASGAPEVWAADTIVGELNRVIADPIGVDPLLVRENSRYRAVQEFFDSVRRPAGCKVEPVTRMCCDDGGEKCGIDAQKLVLHGSSTRVPVLKPDLVLKPHDAASDFCTAYNQPGAGGPGVSGTANPSGTDSHCLGSHSGTITWSTRCTWTPLNSLPQGKSDCSPTCHVSPSASASDWGITSNSCHKMNTSTQYQDAQGAGQTCIVGGAVAAKACIFCQCNVSVQVQLSGSQVTVGSSDGFWSSAAGTSNVCR